MHIHFGIFVFSFSPSHFHIGACKCVWMCICIMSKWSVWICVYACASLLVMLNCVSAMTSTQGMCTTVFTSLLLLLLLFLMSWHCICVYIGISNIVSVLNSVCYACLCGYFLYLILMWAWTLFLFWLHIQTSMPYYSSILPLLLLLVVLPLLLLPLLFCCALITSQPKIYKMLNCTA